MKNCTGILCPMQHGKVDPATCQAVDYCPQATPPKTNADLIRAMTDEELAEWTGKVTSGGYGMCAPGHYDCTGKDSCAPCWLDWLKQEAPEWKA